MVGFVAVTAIVSLSLSFTLYHPCSKNNAYRPLLSVSEGADPGRNGGALLWDTIGDIKLSHSYVQALNCDFQWLSTTCGCSGPPWRMTHFEFVTACSILSLHKSSHQSPAGLLQTLSPCLGQAATSRTKMNPTVKVAKKNHHLRLAPKSMLLPRVTVLADASLHDNCMRLNFYVTHLTPSYASLKSWWQVGAVTVG